MGFKNKIIELNECIKRNYEKDKEKALAEKSKTSEKPTKEENQPIETKDASTQTNDIATTSSNAPSAEYEKIFKEKVRGEIEKYYKKIEEQNTDKKDNSN